MRSVVLPSLLVGLLPASLLAQTPQPKMGAPLAGLTPTQLAQFQAGRVDFTRVFAVGDGLGPIFNQSSCASCHNNPIGGPGSIKVFRFGADDGETFDPLAALGGTLLQGQTINVACAEVIPPEANVTSPRVTPSALGLGLVEAIPDAAIAVRETSPPSPNVSGRVHWVQPLEGPATPRVGRMGWKAQIATVLSFSGDATSNELGITNRLLPVENAPNGNVALVNAYDTVADPEDGPDGQGLHFIDRLTHFQRYLAAPPQTPRSGMAGEAIFNAVGCADCHVASFTTSNDPLLESAIRNKVVKPYSDFLLHEMGLAADFIADGTASVQELRTPSLWGVRNRNPLWHDGRVTGGSLQTRLLGPGGVVDLHNALGSEAAPSATAFFNLSAADQLKVVDFLDSLGRAEFDSNGDNVRNRFDLPGFIQAAQAGSVTPDAVGAVHDFDQNGVVDNLDLYQMSLVYEEDCNGNGINDLQDVVSGFSRDANNNLVADECEFCQVDLGFAGGGTLSLSVCGDDLSQAGARATASLRQGPPNSAALVAISFAANPTPIVGAEILVPALPLWDLASLFTTDASGRADLTLASGSSGTRTTFVVQVLMFDGVDWDLSNAVEVDLDL